MSDKLIDELKVISRTTPKGRMSFVIGDDGKTADTALNVREVIDKAIAALSAKPALIPLEPTAAMIDAGAQRLVNCGEGNSKWPDDYRPVDVRNARNEAERVWRSMWTEATQGKPEPAKPQCGDCNLLEFDKCPAHKEPAKPAAERVECTIGVGDGSGRLFVHGDYDSIKAVQRIIFKAAEHEAQLAAKEAEVASEQREHRYTKLLLDQMTHNYKQADQCAHEREIELLRLGRELKQAEAKGRREALMVVPLDAIGTAIKSLRHNAEHAVYLAGQCTSESQRATKHTYAMQQATASTALLALLESARAAQAEQ